MVVASNLRIEPSTNRPRNCFRISRYFAGHPVEKLVKERVEYLEAKEAALNSVAKPDAKQRSYSSFLLRLPTQYLDQSARR